MARALVRSTPLGLVLLLLLLLVPAPASAAARTPSPWASAAGWVDPGTRAASAAAAATDPVAARRLRLLAAQPQFVWLGDWSTVDRTAALARSVSTTARRAGRVPQLVLYAVPHRDCGGHSAGGHDAARYRQLVSAVAAAVRGTRPVVVVEPDALSLLDCLPAAARAERLALLREAVDVLVAAGAAVYLDAGGAGYHPAPVMASRLVSAGVRRARGVALNVSGYGSTAAQARYAGELAQRVPGLRAVVDTGRNGRGGLPGQWCNVPGQAIGALPRRALDPVVEALVWVKPPGESDGDCGRGEPAPGSFFTAYALGLVQRSGR